VKNRPLVLDPEASVEIEAAESYYERQRPKLGERFHDAVVATLRRIEEFPGAASLLEGSRTRYVVRGARVWRFPYRVLHVELPKELRVVAVAHVNRRTGYWRRRLPPKRPPSST
jgi:toxin ParE1/3/4